MSRHVLDGVLAGLAVAVVLLTLVLVLLRAVRNVRDAARERRVAEVRPKVLSALHAGSALDLHGRRRVVAESVAVGLLRNLRGADRDVLAQLLADGGMLARARRGLRSRSAARRARCAELLGAAGRSGSIRHLVPLLEDPDPDVRAASARALGRIGGAAPVGPLLAAVEGRRIPANTATMALLRIGAAAVDGLLDGLHSHAGHARAVAAELTGSLGVARARPRLEAMVDDVEPAVRLAAVKALGRLGIPSSAATLTSRLRRELDGGVTDPQLALALVTSMGHIGDTSVTSTLFAALGRGHRLSMAASGALAALAPRRVGERSAQQAVAG